MAAKNAKRPRKPRTSSGMKRVWKAKKELRRIQMKINRWKRNQTDERKKTVWAKEQHPHLRPRHYNWNTTGLELRAKQLKSQIKQGKKRK